MNMLKNARNAKRLLVLTCALVLTVAVGAGVVDAATKPPAKKQPTKTQPKKQLCKLAQDTKTCKPNPLFAKTICDTFLPTLQAIAPNTTFGRGYFPSYEGNRVSCFFKANGHGQALHISVSGGYAGKLGPKVTPAQSFAFTHKETIEYLPGMTCPAPSKAYFDQHLPSGPPVQFPVKTRINGYQAYTFDQCVTPEPDTPFADFDTLLLAHKVYVLAGRAVIVVSWGAPVIDVTSAQMMPLVQKLIKTYAVR